MIPTYTEFHQGKLGADFTGVLYSDSGRMNYAAARNGKILVNKRRMNRWFKTEAAALAALQQEARAATPSSTWKPRALAATTGSQFGAIVACALGEKTPAPFFSGRASVTSDGYVMCNFVSRDGDGHMGAFVGSLSDVVRNTRGLADHLKLKDADRAEYVAAIGGWLGRKLEPHGRDYQTYQNHSMVLYAAEREHADRILKVRQVLAEIETLAEHVV